MILIASFNLKMQKLLSKYLICNTSLIFRALFSVYALINTKLSRCFAHLVALLDRASPKKYPCLVVIMKKIQENLESFS